MSTKNWFYGSNYYLRNLVSNGSFGGYVFKLPGFESKITGEELFILFNPNPFSSGLYFNAGTGLNLFTLKSLVSSDMFKG